MTRRTLPETDDRLDEVLAEIERARHEPTWVPEPERTARRLVRAPDGLEDARWRPSRPAALLIGVCAVLAVAVLGLRLLLSSGDDGAAPKALIASSSPRIAGSASVATTGSRGAAATPSHSTAMASVAGATSGAPLSIHVVGAVRRPGVVQVPAGGRVADAVTAAGGMSGADATAINLARPLADGEQVHVPRPGESVPPPMPVAPAAGATAPGAPAAVAGPTAPGAPGGGAAAGGVVNVNTADATSLDALPGVGPVLAQRIVEWREKNGRFSSVDELGEVSGIGDKMLDRLRSKVTV